MTDRAEQLRQTADRQTAMLIEFLSTLDESAARRWCPGREKLGDGTIAAAAMHTADTYERIVAFLWSAARMSGAHTAAAGGHRAPRFPRALGHRPPERAKHEHSRHDREDEAHDHSPDSHGDAYSAENLNLDALRNQLTGIRTSLGELGDLSDSQLEVIPPSGSFRFCDGQRTLEQVLTALLKHQHHQIEALGGTTG